MVICWNTRCRASSLSFDERDATASLLRVPAPAPPNAGTENAAAGKLE